MIKHKDPQATRRMMVHDVSPLHTYCVAVPLHSTATVELHDMPC